MHLRQRPTRQRLDEAATALQRGVIERGEAAQVDEKGQLPPGAYEILGYDTDGQPILKAGAFRWLDQGQRGAALSYVTECGDLERTNPHAEPFPLAPRR